MSERNGSLTPAARAEAARANFYKGFGCAQSVLITFSDVTGLDERTSARLGSSFGGGMGRMREVCGTVSAAAMVLGLAQGYDDPADKAGKDIHYARVRDFAARFKARSFAGSIICREILSGVSHTDTGDSEARTKDYYHRRPCPELCALAAEILQEMLDEGNGTGQ